VVALLAAFGLCWLFGAKLYEDYSYKQELKQIERDKAALISKYKNALPDLVELSPKEIVEEPKATEPSAADFAAAMAAPKKPQLYIGEICNEPSFKALNEGEQLKVLAALRKRGDGFDDLHFLNKCKGD
jgi:hypothetical protein